MEKRLKVLAVAASTHPEKGSEPGLGWGWVESLAKYCDMWVITGEREANKEAIDRRIAAIPGLSERLKIFFIPRPDGSAIEQIIPFFYYRRYRQWHEKAFSLAEKLVKKINFDLTHQINMIGFREPGFLWKLHLPFVWGPVGGTANVPLRFASVLGFRQFFYHVAKVSVNNLQLRYHPRVRAALRRVDGFITSTSDTRAKFLDIHNKDSVVIADTGPPLDISAPHYEVARSVDQPLKLIWSGIHVSRKALPLVLLAVAELPIECKWRLDILGEGPMTGQWRLLANQLGISRNCIWHGWVNKSTAHAIMAKSDIFVFPSLHEAMSTVMMEALAYGLPVICLDHCGMADAVDSASGIKIAVSNPKQVSREIAIAIERLWRNPNEIRRLSMGAQAKVVEYDWNNKTQSMLKVYSNAIEHWKMLGNLKEKNFFFQI